MDQKINPEISVVVCTHNPRLDYLERVLGSFKSQTYPLVKWELLIVDNKSEEPLTDRLDLGWHPQARVVREEELGLTRARVRGIKESNGDLIIFVDDDNVLDADYLGVACNIASKHSNLGAWSGQVLPEFEIDPPQEIVPFLGVLCIRELSKDIWGNSLGGLNLPYGAGMVVRKLVAQSYALVVGANPVRLGLDRAGSNLASSGDLDLALTSMDLGLGTGLFESLRLKHLIAKRRLSKEYILKLIEDSTFGHSIFLKQRRINGGKCSSRIDKWVERYKLFMASPMQKAVAAARERGAKRAAIQS